MRCNIAVFVSAGRSRSGGFSFAAVSFFGGKPCRRWLLFQQSGIDGPALYFWLSCPSLHSRLSVLRFLSLAGCWRAGAPWTSVIVPPPVVFVVVCVCCSDSIVLLLLLINTWHGFLSRSYFAYLLLHYCRLSSKSCFWQGSPRAKFGVTSRCQSAGCQGAGVLGRSLFCRGCPMFT